MVATRRPSDRPHGYVFWNPTQGLWCGVMWAYGIHATYHRDTWREVFDIIDNEVRNEA